MNAKQRRKHKRRGVRMAKELVNIAWDMLDSLEKGELTHEQAKEQLFVAKEELGRM